jgi:hypothetical protein
MKNLIFSGSILVELRELEKGMRSLKTYPTYIQSQYKPNQPCLPITPQPNAHYASILLTLKPKSPLPPLLCLHDNFMLLLWHLIITPCRTSASAFRYGTIFTLLAHPDRLPDIPLLARCLNEVGCCAVAA